VAITFEIGEKMLPEKIGKKYTEFFESTVVNEVLDEKTTLMIQLAAAFTMGCYP